ncbi:MAG: DUF2281 domain-containing protein [Spirulinaceae cyanobacterium SM2_1_0]|nr:DUF2281 domain-containing protein [Spirulinaceae cyanobacterium SM2_1_0]
MLEKLAALPESLQAEVLHYIEVLSERYAATHAENKSIQKKRQAGLLKGRIWMADDFDAPLEDFKGYR